MRPASLLAVTGALVVAQAHTVVVSENGEVESVTACAPLTPTKWPASEPIPEDTTSTSPALSSSHVGNSSATIITTTNVSTVPDETATEGPDTTAGAISQPMKSSVCGLLGFLIVGLVML